MVGAIFHDVISLSIYQSPLRSMTQVSQVTRVARDIYTWPLRARNIWERGNDCRRTATVRVAAATNAVRRMSNSHRLSKHGIGQTDAPHIKSRNDVATNHGRDFIRSLSKLYLALLHIALKLAEKFLINYFGNT